MTYINKKVPHYLILTFKLSVYFSLLTAKHFLQIQTCLLEQEFDFVFYTSGLCFLDVNCATGEVFWNFTLA